NDIQDNAEQTVRASDLFATATVSKHPIIKCDWIAKGTLYLHVGGNEAEFNVIHSADKVIVDDWEKIKSRGNKTISHMYTNGLFDENDIDAQFGELVNVDN